MPRWCRSGAVFGRMSGARIVPVGWLRARSTELSTASPLTCRAPLRTLLPSMRPFVVPLCCLPVRLGAIRMKNGLSVRLPFRGAPEDAEAPRVFHRAASGHVAHAGALCSRTQCVPLGRGDAPPRPSIRC